MPGRYWYGNRIVVDRQPLLLMLSCSSLLPILLPARDVRNLPNGLGGLVASPLQRCGVEATAIFSERQAMHPVVVAPTVDRSVLGIMVDFAKVIPYYLQPGMAVLEALEVIEDRLAGTPCHAGLSRDRVIFPNLKAPELLRAKWLADSALPRTNGGRTVLY